MSPTIEIELKAEQSQAFSTKDIAEKIYEFSHIEHLVPDDVNVLKAFYEQLYSNYEKAALIDIKNVSSEDLRECDTNYNLLFLVAELLSTYNETKGK